jgi:DNA repair protein RecO (recombination protein O)
MDRGYVLHSYPYRETSLILQAWTEKHGRLGLVARGARRPKSAARAILVPFQPLELDWFGKGALKTLKAAEPAAPATPLGGESLMSAFYLNELLLKLTTREDPHEDLFAAYDEAISGLRALSRPAALRVAPTPEGADEAAPVRPALALEPVLRRFELRLLQELGYALELTREAGTGAAIVAEREYFYVVERGPVHAATPGNERADAVRVRGTTLLDLDRGLLEDPGTVSQAKGLMRLLIRHSLNGQELATRAVVRDLQRLDNAT